MRGEHLSLCSYGAKYLPGNLTIWPTTGFDPLFEHVSANCLTVALEDALLPVDRKQM